MSELEKLKLLKQKIAKSNKYVLYVDYYDILDLIKIVDEQQEKIEDLKAMKPLQDLIDTNIIIADYSHNYISKDKIKKFIKDELPDDELMECCTIYDVNGIDLRIKLEKLLEEN